MNISSSSSLSPAVELDPETAIVDQAQIKAKKVVQSITHVITQIKSVESFIPIPPKDVLKQKLSKERQRLRNIEEGGTKSNGGNDKDNGYNLNTKKDGNNAEEDIVHLFHFLTSTSPSLCNTNTSSEIGGNNKEDILARIDEYISSSSQSQMRNTTQMKMGDSQYQYHSLEIDRYNLVHQIFIPLLLTLGETYTILDQETLSSKNDNNVGEEDDDEEGVHRQNHHTKNEITKRILQERKYKTKKTPPIPPKGLLSLSNYTDIASLVELLVCTSIIPLLESSVLADIDERIKHTLPKSLCGRIRKKSLSWGMDVINYVKREKETDKNKTTTTSIYSNGNIGKEQQLKNILHKIYMAKRELAIVCNVISQIILLDRFRPMLLPRHVTDVYATLFQLERLDDLESKFQASLKVIQSATSISTSVRMNNNHGYDERYYNIQWIKHLFLQSSMSIIEPKQQQLQLPLTNCQYHIIHNIQPIDIYTKVKSFQSLLLTGRKKTPQWLKTRVGMLLTSIATDDQSSNNAQGLLSIIDVFVVAASSLPTEEMTGASSRLGKTLCNVNVDKKRVDGCNDDDSYYHKLLGQFVKILDDLQIGVRKGDKVDINQNGTGSSSGRNNIDAVDVRTVGVIHTIWAVLENVSNNISLGFISQLVQGLYPPISIQTTTSINSNEQSPLLPSSAGVMASIERIHALLLYTPLGTHSSDHVLNQFCKVMISKAFTTPEAEITSPQAPGVVSPMSQIIRVACHEGDKVIQNEDSELATDTLRLIIYTIISKCKFSSVEEESIPSFMVSVLLQSAVFNYLDLTDYRYRRCTSMCTSTEDSIVLEKISDIVLEQDLINGMENRSLFIVNKLVRNAGEYAQTLPSEMFKLLLLVYFKSSQGKDTCLLRLPEAINSKLDEYKIVCMMMLPVLCEKCTPETLFKDNGANGVLQIIALIIATISTRFELDQVYENQDLETQLSIASIVMSLLIAMLELGSKKRSKEEEDVLKAMLPSLQALSTLDEKGFDGWNKDAISKTLVLKSELAEMSSHAMAVIVSRSVTTNMEKNDFESTLSLSKADLMKKKIREAELQLASDQPPLRAKAVVNLRQLARGQLEDFQKFIVLKQQQIPSLIVEIDQEEEKSKDPSFDFVQIIRYMTKVCIKALDDKESYVYLASVQTLVAIADVSPSLLMPILIDAVVSSEVQPHNADIAEKKLCINVEQRIKIIEALMFTIRRRGDAIRSHFSHLMDSILYGKQRSIANSTNTEQEKSKAIQQETESYFRGQKDQNDAYDEYALPSDTLEDRQIRVNTGGPVYNNEEEDVLRGALINILAELVTSMDPSSVKRYCAILINLAVNVLHLDQSRVVRRPAALLCRELYACSLRESGQYTSNMTAVDAEFTIELAKEEEVLHATLQRCITGDDVDIVYDDKVIHQVKDKTRLYDPATAARCKEALDIRNELIGSGYLNVVKLYVKSQGQETQLDRFLKKELEKKKPSQLLNF